MEASKKRKLKSGSEFDSIIPLPNNNYRIIKYNAGIPDTVKLMKKVVRETLQDTKQLAELLKSDTLNQTCKNIWQFVYDHIQYTRDKKTTEEIRRPARLWHDRIRGGDCDCYSVFVSSILTNLKIPHALRITDYGKGYQHVYVIVPSNESLRGYYIIDPVLDVFDEEKKFFKNKDYPMNLAYLSGLEDTDLSPYATLKEYQNSVIYPEMKGGIIGDLGAQSIEQLRYLENTIYDPTVINQSMNPQGWGDLGAQSIDQISYLQNTYQDPRFADANYRWGLSGYGDDDLGANPSSFYEEDDLGANPSEFYGDEDLGANPSEFYGDDDLGANPSEFYGDEDLGVIARIFSPAERKELIRIGIAKSDIPKLLRFRNRVIQILRNNNLKPTNKRTLILQLLSGKRFLPVQRVIRPNRTSTARVPVRKFVPLPRRTQLPQPIQRQSPQQPIQRQLPQPIQRQSPQQPIQRQSPVLRKEVFTAAERKELRERFINNITVRNAQQRELSQELLNAIRSVFDIVNKKQALALVNVKPVILPNEVQNAQALFLMPFAKPINEALIKFSQTLAPVEQETAEQVVEETAPEAVEEQKLPEEVAPETQTETETEVPTEAEAETEVPTESESESETEEFSGIGAFIGDLSLTEELTGYDDINRKALQMLRETRKFILRNRNNILYPEKIVQLINNAIKYWKTDKKRAVLKLQATVPVASEVKNKVSAVTGVDVSEIEGFGKIEEMDFFGTILYGLQLAANMDESEFGVDELDYAELSGDVDLGQAKTKKKSSKLKKVWQGMKRVNPVFTAARGLILAALKKNVRNIASRLKPAYMGREAALKAGVSSTQYNRSVAARKKLEQTFVKMGGKLDSLKKVILASKGRLFGLDDLGQVDNTQSASNVFDFVIKLIDRILSGRATRAEMNADPLAPNAALTPTSITTPNTLVPVPANANMQTSLVQRVRSFYQEKPVAAWGITALAIAGIGYGVYTLSEKPKKKRKAKRTLRGITELGYYPDAVNLSDIRGLGNAADSGADEPKRKRRRRKKQQDCINPPKSKVRKTYATISRVRALVREMLAKKKRKRKNTQDSSTKAATTKSTRSTKTTKTTKSSAKQQSKPARVRP